MIDKQFNARSTKSRGGAELEFYIWGIQHKMLLGMLNKKQRWY
jgi:hypothetical protein